MAPYLKLVVRDDDTEVNNDLTPTMVNLLLVLLSLVLIGLILVAALYLIRQRRATMKRADQLPLFGNQATTTTSNHRRLTISATACNGQSSPVYVYNEKRELLDNSNSPPASPVPEIRITFPEDEDDATNKHKSGRVVIVRVSESGGVGLEPCEEDNLPPYQKTDADRFQSLDLERMGGLKEKDSTRYS
ncbi:MAG: hypothetical protein M1834_004796 [Cirrosporium novae-zelandiae]|nr:MAG: hypothetical protein M1834_004796 [Cirrosporium novae-zelandiae]